jgi:hypothetical protein
MGSVKEPDAKAVESYLEKEGIAMTEIEKEIRRKYQGHLIPIFEDNLERISQLEAASAELEALIKEKDAILANQDAQLAEREKADQRKIEIPASLCRKAGINPEELLAQNTKDQHLHKDFSVQTAKPF